MSEQFFNFSESTSVTSMTVDSTTVRVANPSKFPTTGNFRIRIDAELMLVTAVSGDTFTVTRAVETSYGGGAATTHASGSTVEHVLTRAGLIEAIRQESLEVAELTGAVSTIVTDNLTASRAVVSNGSGKVAVSAVTTTELGHLSGVTSAVQTQIDAKASTSSLATVATSGSYVDLSNKPTIPTATDFVVVSPSSNSRNVIQPTNAGVTPLHIKGAASQSVNLVNITNSANTSLLSIASNGIIFSNVPPGTSPISLVSSTLCPNLNANYLGGLERSGFVEQTSAYANKPLHTMTHSAGGGSVVFDYSNGRQQLVTLSAIVGSLQINNPVSTPATLIIVNNGSYTWDSWPSNFRFPDGVTPTITDGGVDVLTMIYQSANDYFLCTLTKNFQPL